MASIPRPEYPRPQFMRREWVNLNGVWEFEIDTGDSGLERGLKDKELKDRITVPFCPESKLSGIGYTDFMEAVWYRKEVEIPKDWSGNNIMLNFQAVDYEATVWVNGREVGRHRGGFTGFSCDLGTAEALGETAVIVVRARDPRDWKKPGGKQSIKYANAQCHYTRTTGIWQTVWMEPVPETRLSRPKITPSVSESSFRLELPIVRPKAGWTVTATVKDSNGIVASESVVTGMEFAPVITIKIPEDRVRLWQPGDGQLYDIELELKDASGELVDSATTYAGLRSIAIDGYKVTINGNSVFQRLVLDQGYYIDGIMTAPTDEALVMDITLSMRAGFNGARLHQKVFEERFLYHADCMGYLVWGEYGDWGFRPVNGQRTPEEGTHRHQGAAAIISQWTEVLTRDYSHPSIIGWCPLNETDLDIDDYMEVLDDVQNAMFWTTKNMDSTRPCLDSSGYSHRIAASDIYDSHDYLQEPEKLASRQAGIANDEPFQNGDGRTFNVPYNGQPYFVSEFGGTWWNPKARKNEYSWGYGNNPTSIEEFYKRFEGLCKVLMDNQRMFGYCYTQLTDVFQEQNGILSFDRRPKFDMARLYAVQSQKAAIEKI